MPFRLLAATFEDFDSTQSLSVQHAKLLAGRFDVEHEVIPAGLAEETFNLSQPLTGILSEMMRGPDAHQTMYVDHHTTRRCLEVLASSHGSRSIALGLHASDLVAGLLNAYATGWPSGPVPRRPVGDVTYVFPLAYVVKKELHLHYLARTGDLPPQSAINEWERIPKDRNFYYFLADFLQAAWPGVEAWLFSGHNRLSGASAVSFSDCANCGASIRGEPAEAGFCDVCSLLRRHGWISARAEHGGGTVNRASRGLR